MRKAEVCPQNLLSWLPDEQVLAPLIFFRAPGWVVPGRPHLWQLESPVLAGGRDRMMIYDAQCKHTAFMLPICSI